MPKVFHQIVKNLAISDLTIPHHHLYQRDGTSMTVFAIYSECASESYSRNDCVYMFAFRIIAASCWIHHWPNASSDIHVNAKRNLKVVSIEISVFCRGCTYEGDFPVNIQPSSSFYAMRLILKYTKVTHQEATVNGSHPWMPTYDVHEWTREFVDFDDSQFLCLFHRQVGNSIRKPQVYFVRRSRIVSK